MSTRRSKKQVRDSSEETIEERAMRRAAIVMWVSFVISLPVLFLFNDIDAWIMTFGSGLIIGLFTRAFDNDKLAIAVVPAYVAAAIAIHRAMMILSGLEKPPHVQVAEISILTAIIAFAVGMWKLLSMGTDKATEKQASKPS